MPINIVVPDLGESVSEATVARWLKQEGEPVASGDPLLSLETDKVDLEVAAERDGILVRILRQPGDDVRVGDVVGIIEESASVAPSATATPESAKQTKVGAEASVQPLPRMAEMVTPVARRMAQEHQVDLTQVKPADAKGRITKEDVQRYLLGQPVPQPAAPPFPAPLPGGPTRREERIRMSRRRRTIAQRLVEAQRTAAMLTTFNEIDMTAVMDLRQRRKESFRERYGVNLGLSAFFVKAVIGALKAFPLLNAEIQGDEIVVKYYYDIGIAIGATEGLVVPVLRDANRMTFAEIEKRIKTFAQQAEEGTLSLEDLRGGTFTLTNGGIFGSLLSTPILNPPQVGILGMHKIEQRPVALNGQVVIRPMMYVALSYDHRIVDGREAVQFLVRVKELVEDPEALLLEG